MTVSLMNEDVIRELLKGHEDILKREVERDDDLLRAVNCPKCRSGAIIKVVDARHPFSSGVLAQWNAKCPDCQCLFSPRSGVIIEG